MTRDRCKVKICGTTSIAAGQMSAHSGANYSGVVVEVPFSERSVSVTHAVEIVRKTAIPTVILVFNRPTEWVESTVEQIQPFAIQLLGHEPPAEVTRLKRALSCEIWKSLFLPASSDQTTNVKTSRAEIQAYINAGADAVLFDTIDLSSGKARFGGTGKTSDWSIAAKLIQACKIPAFLSGGIRPENVKAAIENVRPYGIDLCSGVESVKGVRDWRKVDRLMQQIALTGNGN